MARHYQSVVDELAIKLKAERDASEQRRETLQLKARAIEAPTFDNSDLLSLDRWLVTGRNLDVLAGYFHALAEATGEPILDPEELRVMTVIQYERQLQLHDVKPSAIDTCDREQYKRPCTWQAVAADAAGVPEFGEL